MKVRLSALIAAVVAALLVASGAPAGDEQGTRYYLSLGDSLAAGSERGGDVTRNGKTVTFKGGECDVYPRYVVVNIGTVSPTGSKPYFGPLVGKHPAATTADPVVAKERRVPQGSGHREGARVQRGALRQPRPRDRALARAPCRDVLRLEARQQALRHARREDLRHFHVLGAAAPRIAPAPSSD